MTEKEIRINEMDEDLLGQVSGGEEPSPLKPYCCYVMVTPTGGSEKLYRRDGYATEQEAIYSGERLCSMLRGNTTIESVRYFIRKLNYD